MIDNILQLLGKVKKSGKGYQACCPAHEDRGPSLSLREGDDGRVLLHCFAGCSAGAVMAAIGLTMADLFPASDKPRRHSHHVTGVSRRELQAAAEFERVVLFFLRCDAKRGKPISQNDMRRGQIARQRLVLAGRLA